MPLPTLRRKAQKHASLLIILAGALIVRLPLIPLSAWWSRDMTDEDFWKEWMLTIHQHGLLNIFRAVDTDYVGYHYVLWLLSLVNDAFSGGYGPDAAGVQLLVKTPPILFDLGLVVAVYAVSRSLFEELHLPRANASAIVAAAVFAFQPVVIYDSAVWSQTDSAVTLAMLLSLFFVTRGRTKLGFGVWAIGFLVKPHPIIILPVLLYLSWRRSPKSLLRGLATVASVWLAGLAPWLLHGDIVELGHVYSRLVNADYGGLSAQAWNLWWLVSKTAHPQPDQSIVPLVTYRNFGLLATVLAGFLALFYLHARSNLRGALITAGYLAFAFYMLPLSVHERYLYPFLVFMLPLAVVEKKWRVLYVTASVALFLNVIFAGPPVRDFSGRWVNSPFGVAIASLNCLVFGLFTVDMARTALPSARSLLRRGEGARAVLPGVPDEAH